MYALKDMCCKTIPKLEAYEGNNANDGMSSSTKGTEDEGGVGGDAQVCSQSTD